MSRGEICGLPYDSNEEMDLICWLDELRAEGLCTFSRGLTYDLFDGLSVPTHKKPKVLLKPMSYTPDFEATFHRALLGKLTWTDGMKPCPIYVDGKGTARFEVKGTFRKFSTDYEAPVKIKTLHMLKGIYVQIIKPYALMKDTFYPKTMHHTEKGKERIKDGKRCKESGFEEYRKRLAIPLVTGGEPLAADGDRKR